MSMQKTYHISHLTSLFLGLLFYTSIGLMFVLSNVPLRVIVFLLLLFLASFKKQHYIIIIISCIVGYLISPYNDWKIFISNILSWGCLTGSVLGSLLIYKEVFSGGDFASISVFFKNKNKAAIYSYYVFKIVPMISDLLDRLSKAYMVYGKRKYIGTKKSSKIKIFIDAIDGFFSELLAIMFSQLRVMDRREKVAYFVSQQKKAISSKLLIIQSLIILFIIVAAIISKLKIIQL